MRFKSHTRFKPKFSIVQQILIFLWLCIDICEYSATNTDATEAHQVRSPDSQSLQQSTKRKIFLQEFKWVLELRPGERGTNSRNDSVVWLVYSVSTRRGAQINISRTYQQEANSEIRGLWFGNLGQKWHFFRL